MYMRIRYIFYKLIIDPCYTLLFQRNALVGLKNAGGMFLLLSFMKYQPCLPVRKPAMMAEQLSPDEKFHLITRNLQVSQTDRHIVACRQVFSSIC